MFSKEEDTSMFYK